MHLATDVIIPLIPLIHLVRVHIKIMLNNIYLCLLHSLFCISISYRSPNMFFQEIYFLSHHLNIAIDNVSDLQTKRKRRYTFLLFSSLSISLDNLYTNTIRLYKSTTVSRLMILRIYLDIINYQLQIRGMTPQPLFGVGPWNKNMLDAWHYSMHSICNLDNTGISTDKGDVGHQKVL